MSYKLEYPYTEQERMDFIVQNNHKQGLVIQQTETAIYALEANEMMIDGVPAINPNFEAEQEQKERERIARFSLTRGDVFRGLLQAKGVTRLMLRGMLENNEQLTEVEREMALIDFDEALNFYRGNDLIDTVGLALGISAEQLDKFFETNDYTYLLKEDADA